MSDGCKFFDTPPFKGWGLLPLPLNLGSLQSDTVPVLHPASKRTNTLCLDSGASEPI